MRTIGQLVEALPVLKVRASSASDVASGISRITEVQARDLAELLAKPKPTEKQLETIQKLIQKRDNPELSAGAKTYVEKWLYQALTGKKKPFSNKFTTKGILMEDDAIDIAERVLMWEFAMKNQKHYEDDFFTGTPDLLVTELTGREVVADIKCSFDEESFKFFGSDINMSYYYQLQVYMHLTGREHAVLCYVLIDTPDHLIVQEAKSQSYQLGYDFTDELVDGFRSMMTFSDIPEALRVKTQHFEYKPEVIKNLQDTILECRKYAKELLILKGL